MINITTNIPDVIRQLEQRQRWINERAHELVQRLAEMGAVNVSIEYARAIYNGDKDYDVTVEDRGENRMAIVASGATVLILEFGAGVTYGDGHPQAGEFGFGPGTYPGQRHAMDENGWYFGNHEHTYGNPPSMTMYMTARELRQRVQEVAREVFSR